MAKMVEVFREVRRVLRDDGTFWLNIGDSYNGNGAGTPPAASEIRESTRSSLLTGGRIPPQGAAPRAKNLKPKDLCMMPWRVALALQADGWWIRSVICWAKKSPMPESCRDRPTSSWEPIFLLTKSASYFYDAEAVKEAGSPASASRYEYAFSGAKDGLERPDGGERMVPEGMRSFDGTRNLRNVWHLGPEPYAEAHFATFPTEIPRRAIKAGTSEKGCCPKCGAQWVREVERSLDIHGRKQAIADGGKCSGGRDSTNAATWGALYPAGSIKSVTLGWSPSCGCGLAPVPAIVLDPFLGSGTTVAVARELGRHGVGIELNPEYAKLARERIGRAEKPQTFRTDKTTEGGLFAPIGENP